MVVNLDKTKKPIFLSEEWACLASPKLGNPAIRLRRTGGFAPHSFERFAFVGSLCPYGLSNSRARGKDYKSSIGCLKNLKESRREL